MSFSNTSSFVQSSGSRDEQRTSWTNGAFSWRREGCPNSARISCTDGRLRQFPQVFSAPWRGAVCWRPGPLHGPDERHRSKVCRDLRVVVLGDFGGTADRGGLGRVYLKDFDPTGLKRVLGQTVVAGDPPGQRKEALGTAGDPFFLVALQQRAVPDPLPEIRVGQNVQAFGHLAAPNCIPEPTPSPGAFAAATQPAFLRRGHDDRTGNVVAARVTADVSDKCPVLAQAEKNMATPWEGQSCCPSSSPTRGRRRASEKTNCQIGVSWYIFQSPVLIFPRSFLVLSSLLWYKHQGLVILRDYGAKLLLIGQRTFWR